MKRKERENIQEAWMEISYKYNFMYVRVPKTASRSIVDVIIEHNCDNKDVFQRIDDDPHSNFLYPYHKSAINMRKMYKDKWKDAFKFAFIRNPYERFISGYFYLQQNHHNDTELGKMSFNEIFDHACSTENYLVAAIKPQSEYVMNKKDVVMVDKLYPFEKLDLAWEDIKDITGLKGEKIGIINKTKHDHWSSYYTDAQLEQFREVFYKDFYLYEKAKESF